MNSSVKVVIQFSFFDIHFQSFLECVPNLNLFVPIILHSQPFTFHVPSLQLRIIIILDIRLKTLLEFLLAQLFALPVLQATSDLLGRDQYVANYVDHSSFAMPLGMATLLKPLILMLMIRPYRATSILRERSFKRVGRSTCVTFRNAKTSNVTINLRGSSLSECPASQHYRPCNMRLNIGSGLQRHGT